MKRLFLIALCVAAPLVLVAKNSLAASQEANCSVTAVAWDNDPTAATKEFYIACSDGNLQWSIVAGGTAACAPYYTDMDTVKLYESLATAARLSGHTLNIFYNLCPGTQQRSITSVTLN
jgi:hypothetical protein